MACGPIVSVDPADSTDPDTSDMVETNGPVTTGVNTSSTPPSVTTNLPPDDTGVFDTGPMDSTGSGIPDFPEFCSTIEQDCPPGFKCMPYANDGGNAWNATICTPIARDPNGVGEACTVEGNGVSGIDDCDGSSMCWNVDTKTNEGECFAFCLGSEAEPTCADECNQCSISGDGALTICLHGCDPLVQNCDPGSACYPVNDNFVCAPDASDKTAGLGSPCEFINACPPGLACVDAATVPGCMGGIGCCTPMCPAGGADPCPGLLPGTTCVPFFPDGGGPPKQCVVADPGICIEER